MYLAGPPIYPFYFLGEMYLGDWPIGTQSYFPPVSAVPRRRYYSRGGRKIVR